MPVKHSITFVTAYFTLKETPYFTHGHPEIWNPDLLMDIVSLGVPVCLYIGKDNIHESFFQEWETTYPNFRVMPYRADYKESWIHLKCLEMLEEGYPISLPTKRNYEKDTYEYLVYMNSRVELLEDAISENVWETDHFAWIDFNITKLFKNKETTLDYIRGLSLGNLRSPCLVIPGCWSKLSNLDTISTDISWRFCGGFFIGDSDTIRIFAEEYRKHFDTFLKTYRTIPWEVNFWAYLEHAHSWSPTWYKGDHNDSIVYVSADIYTTGLSIQTQTKYEYPDIPGFYPSSASYLFHQNKHWLNTRYVNYWMFPNGYYRFHNYERVIENKNIVSLLDATTKIPVNYREMEKIYGIDGGELSPVPHPEQKRHFTEGLEDIRLYSLGEDIRFIATTVNYSPNGRPRMMIGKYCPDLQEYRECHVIQPPTDTWCEKNWVPLPKYLPETDKWQEWFIYKWCPFEIGRIDTNGSDTLSIECVFETPTEIFSKIRGSTPFVEYGDGVHLVGLVHFSEEHTPRHYYHMLVLLNKSTFQPVNWSNTFYFEKLSIEFCIGMLCEENTYCFWISRFDRDPLYLTVDRNAIQWIKLD